MIGIQIFHGLRTLQCRNMAPPEAPTSLVTSPLFHVSGLYAGAVIALATGIKSVWLKGRFDPIRAMQLIREEGVDQRADEHLVAYRFLR